MSTTVEQIPEIKLWETHVSGHPKHLKLGDKIVPIRGPYKGVACKILKIEWREELYKGTPMRFYSFYCNRV